MRKIIVHEFISLDGVIQAPGVVVGQPTQTQPANEALAFNNFTKDPGWGDWYKSDTWGKK